MTDTVLLPRLATYSRPSEPKASALGDEPTVMSVEKILLGLASMRAYVSVLITDTVPLPVLATYSRLPSGLSASAPGEEPTEMSVEKILLGLASIFWPVPVLITETVLLPVLATYSRWPSGLTNAADGVVPTAMDA